MPAPPAILNALAIMRAERDNLDKAIAQVSALYGLTDAPTPAAAAESKEKISKRRASSTPSNTNGAAADAQSTKILDALKKAGRPMSPGELATATKLSAYIIGNRLTSMSAKRLVVIAGETSGRRIALPGASAKEAP